MRKNDVFTFTAPNGAEVTAIVIDLISYESTKYNSQVYVATYLAYAQNRIFRCWTVNHFNEDNESSFVVYNPENYILVDYCVIPECDKLLEDHFHQLDLADDYADKTL
jgi:hypothetical protein